jgi:hypothetical protein
LCIELWSVINFHLEYRTCENITVYMGPGDSAIMKSCTVFMDLQMSSPTLNSEDWNGQDMYTVCRAPEFKKTYGRENIRWKTGGEATQEVAGCCVPGRKGVTECQEMEAGS